MPTTAEQARIDRLQRSFSAIEAARSNAERWGNVAAIEAFATALKLIDAAICIEEVAPPFATVDDQRVLRRLREIAIHRDIFGERAAAEAKAKKQEGGEATA